MDRQPEDRVYGRHPVYEVLQSGKSIDRVWISRDARGELIGDIRKLCKERKIPVLNVPAQRLKQEVKGNHQGVLAFLSGVEFQQLEDVLPLIYESGELPFLLILDRVSDVRNIGAIARTAYIAGVHAIVIPKKGSSALGADAMKTSAGALQHIPVCRHQSLDEVMQICRDNGIHIYALSEKGEKMIGEELLKLPLAMLMGSEGEGIHPRLLAQCDRVLKLPMTRSFDSYNVSVAAGMALYEVMRQNDQM